MAEATEGAKPRSSRKKATTAVGAQPEQTVVTTETTAAEAAPVEGEAAPTIPVPVGATASEAAPVEGATATEGKTKKAKAPTKPAIPEDLKKGNRICASCKTPEKSFLDKNPRYSLCQGVDVYCYRKGDRVYYDKSMEEVEKMFPDKVGQFTTATPPLPYIEKVSGTGIKEGILVRAAVKLGRKKAEETKADEKAAETNKSLEQAVEDTGQKAVAIAAEAGTTEPGKTEANVPAEVTAQ